MIHEYHAQPPARTRPAFGRNHLWDYLTTASQQQNICHKSLCRMDLMVCNGFLVHQVSWRAPRHFWACETPKSALTWKHSAFGGTVLGEFGASLLPDGWVVAACPMWCMDQGSTPRPFERLPSNCGRWAPWLMGDWGQWSQMT